MVVVRSLYVNNGSCVFLEGKSSDFSPVDKSVAQGCTLSPTLFSIYITGMFGNTAVRCGVLTNARLSFRVYTVTCM